MQELDDEIAAGVVNDTGEGNYEGNCVECLLQHALGLGQNGYGPNESLALAASESRQRPLDSDE